MSKSYCPICGSPLVKLEYRGKKPHLLALMKRKDFCGFMGCSRTDLHDKVVNSVNYQGQVFIHPVLHAKVWRSEPVKLKRGEKVNFFKKVFK